MTVNRQRLRVRLRTLASMAETAIKQPEKVGPWIRDRATNAVKGLPAASVANYRVRSLPAQTTLLGDLREGGDYALVVLDACRYDAFADVFSGDIVDDVKPVASGGRDTFEYLQVCWPNTYDLPYVSAAVPVNSDRLEFDETGVHHLYNGYQPTEHLTHIDDVWKEAWDGSLGACPPEPVLSRALQYRESDRLAVHYQQPHTPYIGDERELGHTDGDAAYPGQVAPVDEPIWTRVENGEISDDRLRELYWSNLKRVRPVVLRTIAELQEEFDAVVVTADHGEALGEFGVYAHPRFPQHPWVRTVPWIEVRGLTDRGWSVAEDVDVPNDESEEVDGEDRVQERLEALGYK